jgi:hypothetical protein
MVDRKKLIIYTHGGGRFVNQVFSYAHLVAFIEEHKEEYEVINIAFWDYAHLLKTTSGNPLCIYPSRPDSLLLLRKFKDLVKKFSSRGANKLQDQILPQVLHAWGSVLPSAQSILAKDILRKDNILGERLEYLDLSASDSVSILGRKRTTVLAGWGVRGWPLVEKHQSVIRETLSVNPRYSEIAQKYVEGLRDKYDFLIGILIRQTDYRGYVQGKYFFETDQYVRWMKQAKEVFGISGKVGFVVASDERQYPDKFSDLNVHFATGMAVGEGHYVENLVELSYCDIVMTPPSTFGVWAAFLGNVPVLPLCEASQSIDKSDLLHNHIFDALTHPQMSIAVK